jgi:Flp pilus assembly CpaE family ATPase
MLFEVAPKSKAAEILAGIAGTIAGYQAPELKTKSTSLLSRLNLLKKKS